MIRLIFLLCGGLYLALLVLGQDHGQKRYGLMMADQQPTAALPLQVAADPVKQVVFIPAQTVMEPAKVIAVVAEPAETEPALTETATAAALPEPEIAGGDLFIVAAKQVNVREGPGKTYSVVGSLTRGEQVLVVLEDSPIAGWSRVRLEGDGIEGYIATRLLTPAP